MKKKNVLLIGPLPPGWGGARVSFKLFFDYVKGHCDEQILYYDLPTLRTREGHPPGKVNYIITLMRILFCIVKIPASDSVVVFGSRNFCFSYGTLTLLFCRLFRTPFYVRFFGGHPAQNNILKFTWLRDLVYLNLKKARKIIVETEIGESEFPDSLHDKISVVVGYRPAFIDNSNTKPLADGVVRYVYTGAMTVDKGVINVLDSYKLLCERNQSSSHKLELHLYGVGDEIIVTRAKEQDRVIFHGQVENTTLRQDLLQYDIFVFPSLYNNEGHPGSIIEAMMASLPVIATNLSGTREVVENGANGLLVECGNINEMAEAMMQLLVDENLRNQLSEGAKKSSKRFEAEAVLPLLARTVGIGPETDF